jgi:hypothetical protein
LRFYKNRNRGIGKKNKNKMEYVLGLISLPNIGLRRAVSPFLAVGRHIHDLFIPHARNNYHPHALSHAALAAYSFLLIAAKISTIVLLAFGPVLPAFSSAITSANIINLTNQSRRQNSEGLLSENSELDKAAQAKADDMLARSYFAHTTPDGRTPWSFITGAGYSYLMAGENLAVNFTEAEDVETAWMNSPGHRANILNKDFQEIGIGISQGQYQGHSAIFVVQEFGAPAAQQVSLNSQPTAVQTEAVPPPAPIVKVVIKTPTPIPVPASAAPATAVSGSGGQYQVLSGDSPQPSSPAVQELVVQSGQATLDGSNIEITAEVSGSAVKVLAYFGQQAIMLNPTGQTTWSGSVAASELAKSATTVKIQAENMQGKTAVLQLADFSSGTVENYNPFSSVPAMYVTVLGHTFNPQTAESRMYLLFVAALMASLVLAIGIKRHIQHLSLVANTSFVIVLAMMLWWGG